MNQLYIYIYIYIYNIRKVSLKGVKIDNDNINKIKQMIVLINFVKIK